MYDMLSKRWKMFENARKCLDIARTCSNMLAKTKECGIVAEEVRKCWESLEVWDVPWQLPSYG